MPTVPNGPRRAVEIAGGVARAHVVDVTSDGDVERLAADVLAEHGRVDVLVNNVGDYRPLVRFEESTPASWQAMYDVNLRHVFAVTRAFLGSMTARGRGPSSTSTRWRGCGATPASRSTRP